jgi:hypothetical protein
MRLVGTSEWIVVGVLILYIAFTPGFPVVRDALSTGVGKAVGLAVIVATWKYVSHPVALLLLVSFVRCSGMREHMESGSAPPNTHCPVDYTYQDGQCKNASGGSVPAVTCTTGESWDGTKCTASSPPPPVTPPPVTPPPATAPPPPSTSSTTIKQPFTTMTPAPVVGNYQPNDTGKENFSIF